MPSKPFYSMEEVCERLGKTSDDIKALVRDGTLREFRDAGKVFFKSDDIDKLAGGPTETDVSSGDTGGILLEPAAGPGDPAAEEDLSSLHDSAGGTSIIGLEAAEEEEDEEKEGTVITASGIGVFDDDELEIDADPMAKTQITTGATDDQVSLEGAGSGSGLLDLAREADDTALGADLLDEIYPGEEEAKPEEEPAAKEPAAEEERVVEEEAALAETDAGEVVVPVVYTTIGDPTEGLFSGLLVGALALMALACTVVAGALQGFLPDYGQFLGDGSRFYFFLGGAVLLSLITLLVGWFLGKTFSTRRR